MNERDQDSEQAPWRESIYDELHRIAEKALERESPGHSLQPTLLVNDAYLKLLDQRNIDPANRTQVIAAGANIIRRLLVDYARRRRALKRGGDGRRIPLHIVPTDCANPIDIIELHDALKALSRESPRAARIVELKFFGGMTGEEIAEEINVSLRTVNNDWRFAKAWLYRVLSPSQ